MRRKVSEMMEGAAETERDGCVQDEESVVMEDAVGTFRRRLDVEGRERREISSAESSDVESVVLAGSMDWLEVERMLGMETRERVRNGQRGGAMGGGGGCGSGDGDLGTGSSSDARGVLGDLLPGISRKGLSRSPFGRPGLASGDFPFLSLSLSRPLPSTALRKDPLRFRLCASAMALLIAPRALSGVRPSCSMRSLLPERRSFNILPLRDRRCA